MGGRHRLLAIVFVAATFPCPVATSNDQNGIASVQCAEDTWIPANMAIADDYLWSLTNEIARLSPTFRHQLATIGADPGVTVQVRFTPRARSLASLAQTELLRTRAGLLTARIEIPLSLLFGQRYVEMIAHEVEHVLEQVEGLDLYTLAGKPNSGVYRLEWGVGRPYETDRAKAVGRTVTREFHGPEIDSCTARSSLMASPCCASSGRRRQS